MTKTQVIVTLVRADGQEFISQQYCDGVPVRAVLEGAVGQALLAAFGENETLDLRRIDVHITPAWFV